MPEQPQRRAEAEALEPPIPRAPRYDNEGYCLTPINGRNRRPITWEFAEQWQLRPRMSPPAETVFLPLARSAPPPTASGGRSRGNAGRSARPAREAALIAVVAQLLATYSRNGVGLAACQFVFEWLTCLD